MFTGFNAANAGRPSGIKIQKDLHGFAGQLGHKKVECLPTEVVSNLRAETLGRGNVYSAAKAIQNLAKGGLGLLATVATFSYAYRNTQVVKELTKDIVKVIPDALQAIPVLGNKFAVFRNKRSFQQAIRAEQQKKEREIVNLEDLIKQTTSTEKLDELKKELYIKKYVVLKSDLLDKNNQYHDQAHKKQRPADFGVRHPLSYYTSAEWSRREKQLKSQMQAANRTFVNHLTDKDLKILGSVCDIEGLCYGGGNVFVPRDYLIAEAEARKQVSELAPAKAGCRWDVSHQHQIEMDSGKIVQPAPARIVTNKKALKTKKNLEVGKLLKLSDTQEILSKLTFRELRLLNTVCDEAGFCCGGGMGLKVPRQEMMQFLDERIIAQSNPDQEISQPIVIRQEDLLSNYAQNIRSLYDGVRLAGKAFFKHNPQSTISRKQVEWDENTKALYQNLNQASLKLLNCLTDQDLEDLCSVCKKGWCCGGNLGIIIPREFVKEFLFPPEQGYARLLSGETIKLKKVESLYDVMLKKSKEYDAHIQDDFMEIGDPIQWRQKEKDLALEKKRAAMNLLASLSDRDLQLLGSICDEEGICYGGDRGLRVDRNFIRQDSRVKDHILSLSPAQPGYRWDSSHLRQINLKYEAELNKKILVQNKIAMDAQNALDAHLKSKRPENGLFSLKRIFWNRKSSRLREDYEEKIRNFLSMLTHEQIQNITYLDNSDDIYMGKLRIPKDLWSIEVANRASVLFRQQRRV